MIWALFVDWDSWTSADSESTKQYHYEIMEVLSDFIESRCASVAYLEKMK